MLPHVVLCTQLNQGLLQPLQLSILLVVQKFKDGDAVVDLEPEGMHQVVDHDDVLEGPVLDDPEVLDEKAVLSFHAVLSMQKPEDSLLGSVQVVDDGLCVVEGPGCENVDVEVLTHIGKEFEAVGPDVEFKLVPLVVVSHISFFLLVEDGVDQSLIEVHHQKFLLRIYVVQQVPAGSGSLTPFFLMYSCDGPLRLLTE